MIGSLELRQTFFDTDKDFDQLVELQNEAYKNENKSFSQERFKHWYVENPFGKVLSFNAYDGDKMVSHYACVPKKLTINNRIVDGILSMATVTHPNYRRMGLFKTLAKMTYVCARDNGYEFVIGVANANSFPGFMKYFPFQFVGQLDLKVGFGRHLVADTNKTFSGYWNEKSIRWRNKLDYVGNRDTIIGNYGQYARTLMGCFDEDLLSEVSLPKVRISLKPMLYIGLGSKPQGVFVNLPKFVKHSPFNLIFMDLTDGKLPSMNKDNVFFQLFDFDVA